MLNGYGNENGIKINRSNWQKKKQIYTCSTLFCTFLCRCFGRQKRKTSSLHIIFYGGICHMCSPNIFLLVLLFAFIFSLQLIFPLLAASISYFPTASMKFSCFSSNEIRLLCFQTLALALCLLST